MRKVDVERQARWRRIYQEFRASGQSCRKFSAERRIPNSNLKYWARKFESEQSAFVEIAAPTAAAEYTLVLRNGRELRIPGMFSEQRLRQLIAVVEAC